MYMLQIYFKIYLKNSKLRHIWNRLENIFFSIRREKNFKCLEVKKAKVKAKCIRSSVVIVDMISALLIDILFRYNVDLREFIGWLLKLYVKTIGPFKDYFRHFYWAANHFCECCEFGILEHSYYHCTLI